MLDSGATGHYNKDTDDLLITGPSSKQVKVAFGQVSSMAHQALLPMDQLSDKACQTDVLLALKDNSLLSVKVFLESGYTTVFHPYDKDATVHAPNSFEIHMSRKPLLHRHHNENGL